MKVKSINKKTVVIYEVAGEIKKNKFNAMEVHETMLQDLSVKSN